MKYAAKIKLTHLLPLLLGLLFVPFALPASAATDDGIDIVFIMDSSGSMKQNDGQRLRVEAGKMFLNLLDERDRAAVISFSGKAYQVTPLLSLKTGDNEKRLLQGIDKISERGAFTNIYDALDQGHALLLKNRKKNRKQHIVLMSDGNMDVGHKETNLRLTEKTLEEIGPKLAKSRIKVHTITFNQSSNIPLMRLVASDTRGTFSILQNAAEIHDVFTRIFERSKSPDMLPINEDSFIVDDNISEFTVLVSKYKPGSRVALENPDGDEIDASTRHRDVRWYSAKKFDMITVHNPAAGYWLVKYSEGGNKAYIITDLKLLAQTSNEILTGTPLVVRAWLEKDEKLLRRHALLSASQFKLSVTGPDGKARDYALVDDGIDGDDVAKDGYYHRALTFDEVGEYKLDIVVTSETFDRKKTLFVTVKNQRIEANPFAVKDAANVAQDPHVLNDQAATAEHPPKPVPAPTNVAPAAPTHNVAPPAAHEEAVAPEATPSHEPAPDEQPKEADQGNNNLMGSILIFLLLNVMIGVGVGAYLLIKRHKKKQQQSAASQAAAEINLDEDPTNSGQQTQPASTLETDISPAGSETEMKEKADDS